MSIAESAGTALGRKIGPLPLGGWAAIGIGTIVVVKLLRGGGKSSSSDVVTVPDAFAGSADSGGGSGTTLPAISPPAGSGTPAGAPTTPHYRLTIIGRTQFYSTLGKILNVFGASGTYDATRVSIGSRSFYRINRSGIWRLIPVESSTIRVAPR